MLDMVSGQYTLCKKGLCIYLHCCLSAVCVRHHARGGQDSRVSGTGRYHWQSHLEAPEDRLLHYEGQ